jgi:hypothetical protein
MTPIKDYIAQQFIGKKFHFKCDCLFKMDFIGIPKGYILHGDEILLQIEPEDKPGKIIEIGTNHPHMNIEEKEP